MRSLTLHVSALNNAEYTLYTTSLRDLIDVEDEPHDPLDDSRYDSAKVTIREARAWLRGRYNELPLSVIDAILRIISPNHTHNDFLTGGQFFAVMRLVIHARAGKSVEPGLVFSQAYPAEPSNSTNPARAPIKQPPPPPQPLDSIRTTLHDVTPTSRPSEAVHPIGGKMKPPPRPDAAGVKPSPVNGVSSPPVIPPKPSTNPFINRSKSQDLPHSHDAGVAVSKSRTVTVLESKQPPLPPRKPVVPPPPPPRHASLGFSSHPGLVNHTSGKTNVLIQQSLQATRIAQSLKKADERLQQEREFEVLKASSANANTRRTRSTSPTKELGKYPPSSASGSGSSGRPAASSPALPPRRRPSTPPSPRASVGSLEQIANASIGTFKPSGARTASPFIRDTDSVSQFSRISRSPFTSPARSPPKRPVDLSEESPTSPNSSHNKPPPTHPDRKPAPPLSLDGRRSHSPRTHSPTGHSPRLYRSHSMNHPSPPPLPPPIRRKRPDSVQLTPTSETNTRLPSPARPSSNSRTIPHNSLSRHLSLSSPARSREFDASRRDPTSLSDSPMAGLHKTFSQLQQKAQPKLDAARYKAEAGLSKRGFVTHSHHGGRWLREEGEEPLIDEPDMEVLNARFIRGNDDTDPDDPVSEVENVSDPERSWDERIKKLRGDLEDTSGDDDGAPAGGGMNGRSATSVRGRAWMYERDDLKWPAGEGWKPL